MYSKLHIDCIKCDTLHNKNLYIIAVAPFWVRGLKLSLNCFRMSSKLSHPFGCVDIK